MTSAVYLPRRLLVRCHAGLTHEDVASYFRTFGSVVRVLLAPTLVATVDFADAQAVDRVMACRSHTVGQAPVHVMREFRVKLPNRPFPGMEPRRHAAHPPAPELHGALSAWTVPAAVPV